MKIKISIIIPVYNAEKYLNQCLESVLSQSLHEIELLCIDDGSSDDSIQILKNYSKKDKRVKLLYQANLGSGPARNNGINNARGKFIAFMDSDDFYPDKDVLKDLYLTAIRKGEYIVGGSFSHYNDETCVVSSNYTSKFNGYIFTKDEQKTFKDYQFDYGYHRFIYDRNIILDNEINFPSYWRYQDPPYFVQIMACVDHFYALERCTYRYRKVRKKVTWNKRNTLSLMLGLRDELELSAKYNFARLHLDIVNRIHDDFRIPIYSNLEKNDLELWKTYFDMLNAVNPTLLGDELYQEFSYKKISAITSITQTVMKKKNSKIEQLEKAIQSKTKECNNYKIEIHDIKNSISFRLGRTMTFVPRKVIGAIKCCKDHGIHYTFKLLFYRMMQKH